MTTLVDPPRDRDSARLAMADGTSPDANARPSRSRRARSSGGSGASGASGAPGARRAGGRHSRGTAGARSRAGSGRSGRHRRPAHRAARARRASAEQAIAATIVALVVGALLGSDSLVGLAQRQELGWERSVGLEAAHAVDRVADLLSLDRPARWAQGLRTDRSGRGGGGDGQLAEGPGGGATPVPLAPSTPAAPPDATGDAAAGPLGGAPSTTVAPDTPRIVSAAAPLRIYVGGDSMGRELGNGLSRAAPVELTSLELDYQVSTGLSRPDFFDWPARLSAVAGRPDGERPDVAVLIFGTNDDQNIASPDGVLGAGTEPWLAEYRSRVATVMDLLDRPGLHTVWVGLPPMRNRSFDAAMAALDEVYRQEAATRPWITYVDTDADFGGDAAFSSDLRQQDGVHWSFHGADVLGESVWARLEELFDFDDGAVTATGDDVGENGAGGGAFPADGSGDEGGVGRQGGAGSTR